MLIGVTTENALTQPRYHTYLVT